MSRLYAGISIFEANSRARVQAEREAGQIWRDTVLRRLTERNLEPLADAERRFLTALADFDRSIAGALRELGKQ
ncbi:hypothetical protein [Nocardia sp. BMG111209]|uniref:hypothetical protein n=1 Tax=Nocardia sp. BMG111209 TaxID=1160137 RepID=UPI00037C4999|nr:hypothetical protein [Nocardia sp. BMG111209]